MDAALHRADCFLEAGADILFRATGSTEGGTPMLPFAEMNALIGFPAVHAFEHRHGALSEKRAAE